MYTIEETIQRRYLYQREWRFASAADWVDNPDMVCPAWDHWAMYLMGGEL